MKFYVMDRIAISVPMFWIKNLQSRIPNLRICICTVRTTDQTLYVCVLSVIYNFQYPKNKLVLFNGRQEKKTKENLALELRRIHLSSL